MKPEIYKNLSAPSSELPLSVRSLKTLKKQTDITRVIDIYRADIDAYSTSYPDGKGLLKRLGIGEKCVIEIKNALLKLHLPPLIEADIVLKEFTAIESGEAFVENPFIDLLTCLLKNFDKKHDPQTIRKILEIV